MLHTYMRHTVWYLVRHLSNMPLRSYLIVLYVYENVIISLRVLLCESVFTTL